MKHRTQAVEHWLLGAVLFSFSGHAQADETLLTPDERLDPGYTTPADITPRTVPDVDRASTNIAPGIAESTLITGINFKGVDVPANVAKATEPFLGRPANTATLTDLAAAMSAAYKKSPVALFTLAIPNQDLSDGVVDVFIAEGYVEDILPVKNGKRAQAPLLRGFLEPILDEHPATRATYERGISLALRSDGTKVTPRLKTIPSPGAIALILDIEEKENGFAVGYDSRESRLVDSGRVSASAFAYGLVREGDTLRGRLSSTPDGEQAHAANLQYSSPIGTNGLKLALGAVYQATHPSVIDVDGDATFFTAGLSYPLLLDFHREIALSTSIDRTVSSNTALGSVIANEQIDAARLGIKASWARTNRSLSSSLNYSHGLDLENATSANTADTNFNKVNLALSMVQKLGKRVFVRLRTSGQWTNNTLPANERFMFGGADYGRGFDNGLISFDKGYAAAFEPAWRPLSDGVFANSEVYAFADYGQGTINLNPTTARELDLGSAGFGTRIAYKKYVTLGLEYAEPWDQPVNGLDDDPVITFSWSFKYRP